MRLPVHRKFPRPAETFFDCFFDNLQKRLFIVLFLCQKKVVSQRAEDPALLWVNNVSLKKSQPEKEVDEIRGGGFICKRKGREGGRAGTGALPVPPSSLRLMVRQFTWELGQLQYSREFFFSVFQVE